MTEKEILKKREEAMTYDALLTTVLLMKEYFENKEKVKAIKRERYKWHENRTIKCTCDRSKIDFDEWTPVDEWKDKNNLCDYCWKTNQFYERLQKIHKRQRAITLKVRGRVKHCC